MDFAEISQTHTNSIRLWDVDEPTFGSTFSDNQRRVRLHEIGLSILDIYIVGVLVGFHLLWRKHGGIRLQFLLLGVVLLPVCLDLVLAWSKYASKAITSLFWLTTGLLAFCFRYSIFSWLKSGCSSRFVLFNRFTISLTLFSTWTRFTYFLQHCGTHQSYHPGVVKRNLPHCHISRLFQVGPRGVDDRHVALFIS